MRVDNPTLGDATADTQAASDSSTKVATTAYVDSAAANVLPSQATNSGKYLTTDGADASWGTLSSGGDVSGPASSGDNAIVRYNGTTGKIIQNTGVSIDDSNNLGVPGTSILLNNLGDLTDTKGISFYGGNTDYRMGFDDVGATKGYIRTNVDSSGSSIHGFVWSGGDLSAGTEVDYMLLTTAGVLTLSGLGQINATSITCDNIACEAVDPDYVIYVDQKSQGVAGGSSAAASWQTRTLNTVQEEKDTSGSFSSLSSNQFTLQAGRYKLRATVPTYMTQRSKSAIINVTDSTVALVGNTAYNENGYYNGSHLTVIGEIDIASPKTFEVWHYTQFARGTYGLGVETTASGYAEKYTIVEIYRLGD